jgi:hypothetical protein
MRGRRPIATITVSAAAAVAAFVVGGASAAGTPMVADANADEFVTYSAWATLNEVSSSDCTGKGASRKVAGVTFHATFSCTVETLSGAKATVSAKALGPEWFRITPPKGSGLKPEPPLGVLPKGPLAVSFSDAGTALERSAWGKANDVDTAFCLGVGPVKEMPAAYFSFTFSCATLDTFASRGPHVLISVDAKGVARVIRTLVP